MVRRTTLALALLSLGVLPLVMGCKSSNKTTLAEKVMPRWPGGETPAADPAGAVAGIPTKEEGHDTARREEKIDPSRGSTVAQVFHKATSWLPFHRSDEEVLGDARVPEQRLPYNPFSARVARTNTIPKLPARPTSSDDSESAEQRNAVASSQRETTGQSVSGSDAPRSTPSLVRRSRRPPPDPAPKPPEDGKRVAKSKPTDNPYVESKTGDSAVRGKTFPAQTAAADTSGADGPQSDGPQTAGSRTYNQVGLKFLPPTISNKKANAADGKSAAAVAKDSTHGKDKAANGEEGDREVDAGSSKQQVAEKKRTDTIPRREDMIPDRKDLVGQDVKPAGGEDSEGSDRSRSAKSSHAESDTESKSVPDTRWVAKPTATQRGPRKSSSEKELTSASAVANMPTDFKRVVADTFAAKPRRRAEPGQTAHPASRNSAFVLPTREASATGSPASQPATVAEVSKKGQAQRSSGESVASTAGGTDPAKAGSRSDAPSGGGSRGRGIARSDELKKGDTAVSATGSEQRRQQREAAGHRIAGWQTPVPFAPSRGSSYESYYHRGVLPGATSLSPGGAPAARMAEQAPAAGRAVQPTEYAAPLVDANAYRGQQWWGQQPPRTASSVPIPQPGTQSSWLATYQRLKRQNSNGQQQQSPPQSRAPRGSAARTLSSGR